jgi:two-component system, sensor histidine kinase
MTRGRSDNLETLRARLAEANETLLAIRSGDVDAVVMQVEGSDQVYTLCTADKPYRDLIEQMQEGAVVLAGSGDILYCNARFAALVGASLESVIGTPVDRFVHASAMDGFETLLNSRDGKCHSRLNGADGRTLNVSLSLTTTVSKGAERLNLIVTDLGEILEAHSNRDRAERDSRMKDDFLAMLAHELRSPLAAINSAVEVLELTNGGGESETRARRVIGRQVGHLARLIDDLLDVERVVSGTIKFNPRPLDLGEAVRRAVSSFLTRPGLDLQIDIDTEPVWVQGDAVRLEQVLANLLTNAIKFTPADGRIQVTLRGDGTHTLLTVEDAGLGISSELLPFIFDTFIQGDRTLDRAGGGLGIGLTLVRRLVEMHGGTVEASSQGEGHGSRFTVRLRQIPSSEASAVVSSALERAERRRVLLIDDSPDAREMLRLMLELEGHVVFDAADGVVGLALLETEHPDVAIIDIGLPGLDGHQIARRIRERPSGNAVLLLALTGYGFADDYQRSAEAGFDHHLVKPVDVGALSRLLRNRSGRIVETDA